jgi:cytoplasmic tRNA 2-thiolation protein 2
MSRRGRTSYELFILMVEMPCSNNDRRTPKFFDVVQRSFPSHHFSLLPLCHVFQLDRTISEDLASLSTANLTSAQGRLEDLMSTTRSASTRADLLDILLTRLVVAFAKENKCEAVLWGHSTSRLAAKSLAAVAEGRGGSLPFLIADGLSPLGVHFYYPLRDLFKPELVTYSEVFPETFSELLSHGASDAIQPTSIRNTSINNLLANYIGSQGERYPSLMANVVRTACKLQAPVIPSDVSKCFICAMPSDVVVGGQPEESGGDRPARLCFACQRSKNEMKCRT